MKIERINLGAIIKGLTEERGLKPAQFARMVGLKRQNVTKTIFDKQSLDTNLLCVISEVLDCNLFDYYKCNQEDNKTELRATLTIEMGKEKKDRTLRFVFGENNLEIK